MIKIEERKVKVMYCDYCKSETKQLNTCALCKREMCNKEGGAAHSAFSAELYEFDSRRRLDSSICRDCAEKKFDGTIRELFGGMMSSKPPVPLR